jgi:hypothetical protein
MERRTVLKEALRRVTLKPLDRPPLGPTHQATRFAGLTFSVEPQSGLSSGEDGYGSRLARSVSAKP